MAIRSLRGAILAFACLLVSSNFAKARPASDVRSIDGSGNNLYNSDWGAAEQVFLRNAPSNYSGDGSGSSFYNSLLPNPREVSNALYDSSGIVKTNKRKLSNMVWQWGQFLDHDITLTHVSESPSEFAPIFTDPSDAMSPMIPFSRSVYDSSTGTSGANPRQQINSITAYVDASNVYGSDAATAYELRDLGNGGRMKVSAGDLLPFDVNGSDPSHFIAGDERANEQVGLTSMHTLFVREHNRLAGLLEANNPNWSDEQLYQTARKIVGAEMQAITYNEFLPMLLGRKNARKLKARKYDYDPYANPSISNEFATAAYRFGHSMLPEEITLPEVDGYSEDSIALKDAFFSPGFIASDADGSTNHVEQLLLGLSTTKAQEIDGKLADGVRNFLFGDPGSGGMDLAALNIQRGRDHGLASYNELRVAYGLDPADNFRDITRNREVRRKLKQFYGSPDNIDAWVGVLVEDHIRGGSVGELAYSVISDQFLSLRDGDRYFYWGDDELMANWDVRSIINLRHVSLSDIISWNTSLDYVPDNVFKVKHRNNQIGDIFDQFDNLKDKLDDFFSRFGSFGGSNQFGNVRASSGFTNVPEPSSVILLLLGAVGFGSRRNRSK